MSLTLWKICLKSLRYESIKSFFLNGNPVVIRLFFNSVISDTLTCCPFKNAPFPFSAVKSSFLKGSNITPTIISFLYSSAIDTENTGYPCI